MSSASQLRRILALIPELADDRDHSVERVSRRLGIDRNTLLKDLRSLAERFDDPGGFVEGLQIYVEGDEVSLRTNHFLRPMRLTLGEVGALELGLAMLRAERPPEEHAALDRARDRLARVMTTVAVTEAGTTYRWAEATPAPDSAIMGTVRSALRDHRKVVITYRSGSAQESRQRTVCPYSCAQASGAWYLVGHCDESDGLRVFRFDRIEDVTPTAETFEVPTDFLAESVVREGKVFLSEAQERVRIRYGRPVARWIAEREGKALDADGTLTMEHPLADPHWVVRHVLQYGPDAEVLEPRAMREAVAGALAAMR